MKLYHWEPLEPNLSVKCLHHCQTLMCSLAEVIAVAHRSQVECKPPPIEPLPVPGTVPHSRVHQATIATSVSGHARVPLRSGGGKLDTSETCTNVCKWSAALGSNHTCRTVTSRVFRKAENKSTVGTFRKIWRILMKGSLCRNMVCCTLEAPVGTDTVPRIFAWSFGRNILNRCAKSSTLLLAVNTC